MAFLKTAKIQYVFNDLLISHRMSICGVCEPTIDYYY